MEDLINDYSIFYRSDCGNTNITCGDETIEQFIVHNNQELSHINEKISILINQLDDYREERLAEKLGIEEGNIKLEITE